MSIYQNTKTHLHHIVPKRMGGTDDPSNLVELTIYDHAIAHRHLWKMYGDDGDRKAYTWLISLADQGDEYYENISESTKKLWSDPDYRKRQAEGRLNMDKEVNKRIGESIKKHWKDPEYRERQRQIVKNRWSDPEFKTRASEATKRGIAAAKARRAAATTQES